MNAPLRSVDLVDLDGLPEYPLTVENRLDSHYFMAWERRRWLNSEMRLRGTHECRALYFDLICISYDQAPLGTLPDDHDLLAKLLMVDAAHFRNLCKLDYGPLHSVRNGMQGMSDVTGAAARAQKEAADAAAITAAAMRGAGEAAEYTGQQVGGAAVHTQKLTGDMNNLGLALATGRDPADALSEAARKAAKSFNDMGAGASAAREVGSAFMATPSPINLGSIGLISFGTAAVGWLFKSSDAAKTLDEQIDKLTGAVSRYTSASQAAKTSSRDLAKEYGSAAAEAQKALDNLASIDRYKAMEEVGKSIDKILKDTTISLKNVSPYLRGYTDDANQLAFSFKLTGDAATSVAGAINRLEASKGVRDQVMAASRLSDELMTAYGSLTKMPDTAREVYVAAQSIVVEGGKVQDWIRMKAKREDRSQNYVINRILTDAMEQDYAKA